MQSLLYVSEEQFNGRVTYFNSLPLMETNDEKKNGDYLFGGFPVGNTVEIIQKPYERFHDYEKLLLVLKNIDQLKYNNLHKGTPFYFLAWLAFDFKSYNKGLYYIDAAIAEDIVHRPTVWQDCAAAQFYYLKHIDVQAIRTVSKIRELLETQFSRFVSDTGNNINITDFVEKFVKPILNDSSKTKRSLISAIYIFLLEFEDLYKLLKIRTAHGGSILPFVDHLFNGGVIFESLLKEFYPKNGDVLEKIMNKSKKFKIDFPSPQVKGSANNLKSILSSVSDLSFHTAFSVTSKLRNTTGHKVVWDDIFDDPENFKALFEQEVNAIFYLLSKKILDV